jgi:hypothetical protein
MMHSSPHNQLLQLSDSQSWNLFSDFCETPEKTQQEVLRHILNSATDSRFGKEHAFGRISTMDDFIKSTPITEWSDYAEPSSAMQKGAADILFNAKPEFFIMTSGTSGKQKLLPETHNGMLAKAATDKLRRCFTAGAYPEIMQGQLLILVNSADMGLTEGGTPFGTASGLTLSQSPKQILDSCAFPPDILKIKDPDALDYLTMRFALEHDVRAIVGNNIARMDKLDYVAQSNAQKICDDIAKGTISDTIDINSDLRKTISKGLYPNPERADFLRNIIDSGMDFIPSEYWPELRIVCCWLSGSVGASVASVRRLLPEKTVFLDYGYGASEGKFNIPHIPESSAGPLAIHAAFYEFIPANNDSPTPAETLLAHQLQKDGIYRMLITTYSGLYRYDMHDLIRVTGFYKNTPEIVFVSKTGDIGNIAGEKLCGSTICSAVATVSGKLGISIRHTCAVTVPTPPHYIFCIEPTIEPTDIPPQFVELLDREIRKDIGYGNKRRDNLLAAPELRIMKTGWREAIYRERNCTGISSIQAKLPVIYKTIPCEDFTM